MVGFRRRPRVVEAVGTAGCGLATRFAHEAPDHVVAVQTDPRLCAAIVDRLTFKGAVIQTATESYLLAHPKAQAERAQVS